MALPFSLPESASELMSEDRSSLLEFVCASAKISAG